MNEESPNESRYQHQQIGINLKPWKQLSRSVESQLHGEPIIGH
jgi:hypothetical protein